MIRLSRCHQRSGGIQQHNIPPRGLLPTQHRANDRSILNRIAARYFLERSAFHPKLFRLHFVGPHRALARLRNSRHAGDRDLVQPIQSVHNERAPQSQHAQRLGQFLHEFERVHAHYLPGSPRRICQRSKQVEHGAHPQLATHPLHLLHRRMQVRRIKKADSNFAQTLRRPLRRELDVDAQSLHHIRRAALRTDAAVPVLGHANARSRCHQRSRRGYVESPAGIAAGAAGVDKRRSIEGFIEQSITSSPAHRKGIGRRPLDRQRRRRRPDRLGESHNLLDGFALHAQRDQQGRDLRVGALARQTPRPSRHELRRE